MRFIKKIKEIYNVSQRINVLETEIKEMDSRLKESISNYSAEFHRIIKEIEQSSFKQFKKKVQDMTFAYTKDLDDTKSDYLKRYLEQRMDGMQYDVRQIPLQLAELRKEFMSLENTGDNSEE